MKMLSEKFWMKTRNFNVGAVAKDTNTNMILNVMGNLAKDSRSNKKLK
jgi:hypothetical protein